MPRPLVMILGLALGFLAGWLAFAGGAGGGALDERPDRVAAAPPRPAHRETKAEMPETRPPARPENAARDDDPAPGVEPADEMLMPRADPAATCELLARVLGSDGRPRAQESFLGRLVFPDCLDERGEPVAVRAYVHTDGFGGLIWRHRGALAPGRVRFELWPEVQKAGISLWVPPVEIARRDLPGPVARGRTILGDLVLEAAPLVAAGLVLDETGNPLAGARVEIAVTRAGEGAAPMLYEVVSGADGRFELRGEMGAVSVRVKVEDRNRPEMAELEAPAGTDDLVLRLRAGGEVRGKIRFAPGATAAFRVELHAEGRILDAPARWENAANGTFSFSFRGVPTGISRLVVREASGVAIWDAPVEVRAGATTAALDLDRR
ncbi:MAG: carboxypeptidase-like regulatory domain-containing protein [Planctomycetota bacterium]